MKQSIQRFFGSVAKSVVESFKQNRQRLFGAAAMLFVVLVFLFHDSHWLFFLGTFELVLIGLVVNSFVFIYYRRNWKANPYGRALMYSKISLAVLVDMSLLTAFMGSDWEWRAALRVILFSGILIAQTRLLQLLFSLRHKQAREEYRNENESNGKDL